MKEHGNKILAAACAAAAAAVIFTILVCFVDKKPIGLEGSEVGFAGINGFFAGQLPYNEGWYRLTKVLGIIALAAAAGFACVGVLQLIQRKSLLKVDHTILALGVLYLTVLILYVLFNKLAINYRPVDLGDGPEPSYPSTHTLLACCIMGSAIFAVDRVFASKKICLAIRIACAAILVMTVVGRLLSGVHWFTDIIGGVLISTALVLFFAAFRAGQES